MKSYRDLEVWQKSIELVKDMYFITRNFPDEERYGLASQMRRCVVSIPSNIAEGKTRGHTNEYIQFLYIALGSSAEIETQLIISNELKYIPTETRDELLEKIDHIARMIRNLIKALRK
ncbi:MAG: four helix bundle protein [Candidatus Stahlbacteria bacterium]|nr:four helix bundle protein [Candidatus Stahlbacteria bacterium]